MPGRLVMEACGIVVVPESIPTRHEVLIKLSDLADGSVKRDEAASWARTFLFGDADIEDEVTLDCLHALAVADSAFGNAENFLYDVDDFQAWFRELSGR